MSWELFSIWGVRWKKPSKSKQRLSTGKANGWLRRGGGGGGLEEEEEEEAEKKRAVGGLVGKGRGLERREEPWRGRRRRSEFLFLVHCTAETLGRYGKLFGEEKEKKGVELVLLRAGLGTPSIHLSLNQIWPFFI